VTAIGRVLRTWRRYFLLPGINKYGGAVYVCSFLQKKIDTIHSFAANEDLIIKLTWTSIIGFPQYQTQTATYISEQWRSNQFPVDIDVARMS
jgi:hypothetical protein